MKIEDRFLDKVSPEPNSGCWLWTAYCYPNGYGAFWTGDRTECAHRVSYRLFTGEIPSHLQIDHLCRVRSCVNPDHLELVTLTENVLRGIGAPAVNARKSHCIHGHPFDEENTYISSTGARKCRVCIRARKAKYYAQKRRDNTENRALMTAFNPALGSAISTA